MFPFPLLFHHFPFLESFHVPFRFIILAIFSLSLLVALALTHWTGQTSSWRKWFFWTLALWIGATKYIDVPMAAILVVVLMVVLQVVSWDDIMKHTQAWTVLIWFAALLTMADGLAKTRFVDWVGQSLAPKLGGLGTVTSIVMLVGAFYFLRYLFASGTAHVSALFPVLLGVAVTIPGVTRLVWALLLCYTIGLVTVITPYAGAVSPIYYGCGYIKSRDFWLLGTAFGLVFFVVYLLIGVPWLMFLKF